MKTIVVIAVAIVGGFIGGIVLAEWIGIIGNFLFDRPAWLRGVKYLPFIAPFFCLAAAAVMLRRNKI